jgi:Protein of unknown function (DUF4232)
MTGSPDDHPDGPGGDGTDPLEPLLRPPVGYLAAPPGAFERIRHRAARRRRLRATAGGTAVAAVIAGALYTAGVLTPDGRDQVVGPPASSARTTTPPAPTSAPPTTPSALPPTGSSSAGAGLSAGGQGTATTPPGTVTGAPATPTPGSTPMCAASQLTASLGSGDAGAGNLYRYLVLTNHGATACHLAGYPGLSMLDAGGKQIGRPAGRQPMTYAAVVLKPGGSASDTIHTANQQGTCLPASARLKLYPPGSKASLTFPGAVTDCDDLFEITPFTAGSTGNPPA